MAKAARTVPRSRALALLAWLACALLSLGPAVPALHFTLVAHRLCLEHGELEHVASDAAGPSASALGPGAPASRTSDPSQSVAPGRGGSDDHGHELCGMGGSGGSIAVPPQQASACTSHFRVAAPASASARAHQSIALLSYAPKLAPPARA